MKRTKKFLVGLLASVSVLCGSLGLVACGDTESSSGAGEATQIEKVYAQYVVYAQAEGQEPLSYEEWLLTIKGDKGEKGDTGAQGEKGEKGVGIEKVEFDENGDLVVTLTDGTRQTVEMPTVESSGADSLIDKGATEGLHYQKIVGKEEYCVMGLGLASESDIVISSTYKGLPVTMIGARAFQDCPFLTSIKIPDSVTMIFTYAFFNCYNLTSVEIGNGVTTIFDRAFGYCNNLQFNEYGNAKYLGSKTNEYFALIEVVSKDANSYTIHDDTKIIACQAFYDCDSLMSIEIPDSVTSIAPGAFDDCDSLQFNEYGKAKYLPSKTNDYFALIETKSKNFSSYTIHNDTKIIADGAFYDCYRLTSIEIPDSVTSIGDYAFAYCYRLTSVYYKGTAEDWAEISIDSENGSLTKATRYYYSETTPSGTGNYWHYNEQGEVAVW